MAEERTGIRSRMPRNPPFDKDSRLMSFKTPDEPFRPARTRSYGRRTFWICAALAALTLAVYAQALRCQFLAFDDEAYVTENRHVLPGLTFSDIDWAFRNVTAGNWHPLT